MYHSNNNGKLQEEIQWQRKSPDLVKWAKSLQVRGDAYGSYYERLVAGEYPTGEIVQVTKKEPLTDTALLRHFQGTETIGLHIVDPTDDTCVQLGIDIDLHDEPKPHKGDDQPNPADPFKNLTFALVLYNRLAKLGIKPLLTNSNGKGGYHLRVLWAEKVPAALVRTFGLWLTADYQTHGVTAPEVFPKQETVKGKFGNWLRLPGKHHKRNYWSEVWNGLAWLKGSDAAEAIIETPRHLFSLVPEEARQYEEPKKTKPPRPKEWEGEYDETTWVKNYEGDLRTLDIEKLFADLIVSVGDGKWEVKCPWIGEHTTDTGGTAVWHEEGSYPTFNCLHAHCASRCMEEVCAFFGREKVDSCCGRVFDPKAKERASLADAEIKVDDFFKSRAEPEEKIKEPTGDAPGNEKSNFSETKDDPSLNAASRALGEDLPPPKPDYRQAYSLKELDALPEASWLIDQIMTDGGFVCSYGVSGSGKSFVELVKAMSIASGVDFLGQFKVAQGPVLYICSEGGRGIKKRAHAWLTAHGISPDEDLPIRFIPAPFNLTTREEALKVLEIGCKGLQAVPVFVVVDTLSRNIGGATDRDAEAVMNYILNIDWIIAQTQAAVSSVHHAGLATDRERGVTQLRDSCDTMIQLAPENLANLTQNSLTTINCTKQKDEDPFDSFVVEKELYATRYGATCYWKWRGWEKDVKIEVKQMKVEEKEMNKVEEEMAFLAAVPFGKENAVSTTKHRDELLQWKRTRHQDTYARLREKNVIQFVHGRGQKPDLLWREL